LEIKYLTYKQFALIREAIIEKRDKLWYDKIATPFAKALKKIAKGKVKDPVAYAARVLKEYSE